MIPSILLVEDDVSLRRIMQLRLEAGPYRVTCAASAEEAFAALERQPFHLVVSDLMMPGLSGLDLLKRIKADAPNTPVILLTAYAIGIGLPFVLTALTVTSSAPLRRRLAAHARGVRIASGVLLIVVGVAVASGRYASLLSPVAEVRGA